MEFFVDWEIKIMTNDQLTNVQKEKKPYVKTNKRGFKILFNWFPGIVQKCLKKNKINKISLKNQQ